MSLLGLLAVLSSSVSLADTRVLVRFDETGHYSHRISRSEADPIQSALSSLNKQANPKPGSAYIRWLDETGQVLEVRAIPDPRVTHAPLDGNRDLAWVAIREGAYTVRGPFSASLLEITLPEKSTPLLPREVWKIDLSSVF